MPSDCKPDRYTVVCTCYACPEQYDVFKNDDMDNIVGYLRLRHGTFRVAYPNVGDGLIYEGYPQGDGIFTKEERPVFLYAAVLAIHEACGDTKGFSFFVQGGNDFDNDADYYQ